MADIGSIPPWIKPADEADYLQHGIQLGAQIGQQQAHEQAQMQFEQAKQDFYQQEALKAQQLAAQRDARAQAEFGLQAAAAARKTEAMAGYQKAVQSGVDPLQAMLQYGPAMGQPATSIAAAQRALEAKQSARSAPELVDLGGGVKGVRYGNTFHVLPQQRPQGPKAVHVGNKLVNPETGDVIFDGDKGKWSKEDTMRWEEASREMIAAQKALATPFVATDPQRVKEAQAAAAAAKADRAAIDAKYAPKSPTSPSKRFKWDKTAGRLVPVRTPAQPQAAATAMPSGDSGEESGDEEED